MKIKTFFLFLPIIFLLLYCNSPNKSPIDNDEAIIKKLISNYSRSFDNKDFEEFSTFCSDDFKFFTLDGQSFDKNTVGSFLNRVMSRWKNLKTEIEELNVHVDNQLAFARYKQKLTYVSGTKNGKMNSLITVAFIKITDSDWKMIHYHMTTKY